jgi:outer membrane protein OmpA-like peptidoglycan-associated protein
MPEQAQRRAPIAPPEEKSADAARAVEDLHRIELSSEEPQEKKSAEIRSRADNLEGRAEAVEMRRDRDDDAAFAEALAPTIQATLRESVRTNPHVLADALFPVMGPAIRKSITETLRSMIESFNEALEHSLSWRGIQWRVEAIRTGKPFAEIVLMHSLLFRVEQVFLIHRETGLVLNHVTAAAVLSQDPAMVAGMLSAIQQFVRDSFSSPREESLDSMTVGGLEVWIEEGPHAVLAAVIRGHAPADYRVNLKETLEATERDFGSALDQFHGDAAPFRAADGRLQNLLVTHYREKRETRKPKMAIAAGVLLLALAAGWIGYVTYEVHKWSEFARAIGQHPGIVVTSYEKSGGRWRVHGFRDPLAADPSVDLAQQGLKPSEADLQLVPFYSLDDSIVTKRALKLLSPPHGVELEEHGGNLAASGTAPSQWIAELQERAPMIAGVSAVDVSQLRDAEIVSLESVVLTFPVGGAELDPGQGTAITQAGANFNAIRSYAARTSQKVTVSIIGHTDSTGVEGTNQVLSRQRAATIAALLAHAGVPADALAPRGVGTTQPLRAEDTEEGRRLNRSVTFAVTLTPASPAP